jgi:uridine kinase
MTIQKPIRLLVGGLLLRAVICSLFVPILHNQWFVLFIQHLANNPSIDPWTSWLNGGGDMAAFPYGVGMILISIPAAISTHFFGLSAGSLSLLFAFTVLDAVIGFLIIKTGAKLAVVCSWVFSPVAIYVTFVLGQTDITVAFMILLVVIMIQAKSWKIAGIVFGFAALFKLSALLFLPFVFIFAIQSPRERSFAKSFIKSSLLVLFVGMLPMWYSHGFRQMVLFNRETGGLLDYTISLGRAEPFQLVPLVYSAMLYLLWRQGRTTSGVMCVVSVSAIAAVAIIAPSSTGWYLWFIPTMLVLSSRTSKTSIIAMSSFQIFAVVHAVASQPELEMRSWTNLEFIVDSQSGNITSFIQTLVMTSGILSVVAFVRATISREDPLGVGTKPLTIGIAGDSGSGKSTLSESIIRLFPVGACQVIEGDDYHLYERNSVEWKTLTHLNPLANNLSALESDVRNAKLRKVIKPRTYDHSIGKFRIGREIVPGDVLVVNGLHSLYLNQKDDLYDVGVYISMNESLREKLKVKRDSTSRGANEEQVKNTLAKRKIDSDRFIKPQEKSAQIVFEIDYEFGIENDKSRLSCNIRTRTVGFLPRLADAITSIALVPCQLIQGSQIGELELSVQGDDLTSADLITIARHLDPDIGAFIPRDACFATGTLGLQSLVVLLAISEKRRIGSR